MSHPEILRGTRSSTGRSGAEALCSCSRAGSTSSCMAWAGTETRGIFWDGVLPSCARLPAVGPQDLHIFAEPASLVTENAMAWWIERSLARTAMELAGSSASARSHAYVSYSASAPMVLNRISLPDGHAVRPEVRQASCLLCGKLHDGLDSHRIECS